jgi:hypothetical protein
MTAPLPCPFCGHEADPSRIGFRDRYAVVCSNDYCPVESQATGQTMDEAIKLWNTRHV